MKVIHVGILLLVFYFTNCDSQNDCSQFESFFQYLCENLYINSTHRCQYSNNKCELTFEGCASYKGDNDKICESIEASSLYYKCKIQSSQCTQVPKECSDYKEGITSCTRLNAGGDSKYCVLNQGKCESHFKTCNLLGTNKDTCEGNIPLVPSNECKWSGSACEEKVKECSKTKFTDDASCSVLVTTDSDKKRCIYSVDGCKEEYLTCELYNDNTEKNARDKTTCHELRTSNDLLPSTFVQRCVFDDTEKTCSTGTSCSQFNYEIGCKTFTPSDRNKRCYFKDGNCKEIYKTCELYNNQAETKEKSTCEEIEPYYSEFSAEIDYHSKCVFENSQCLRKKKPCSEITDKNICETQI